MIGVKERLLRHFHYDQIPVKSRTLTSKIPPRFAKKQGNMSLEQPEETLSSNNLGTEIWETNSSGMRQNQLNKNIHIKRIKRCVA